MSTTMTYLRDLCALDGTSGHEQAVLAYILEKLDAMPTDKTVTVDVKGNVIVRLKGRQPAAKTVMFAAHMDEVGLIVTDITEDGYLKFARVGGIDDSVLLSRRVRVNGQVGVIGCKAVHLCSKEEAGRLPDVGKLQIDIGADSREEAEKLVRIGDTAVFEGYYRDLDGDRFTAKAIDDRAGCAVLLTLAENQPERDMVIVFTVQEEIGLRGAGCAAFAVAPDIAVAVDATTASDIAGVPAEEQVCAVGHGAVVSFMDGATLYDAELFRQIMDMATEQNIAAQPKRAVGGGNDAGAMQRAGVGARVAAVSLPCRYIHSAAGVAARQDVESMVALLGEMAVRLTV